MHKQMALVSQMLNASSIKFGYPNGHIAFSPWLIIVKLVFYFSRNELKCICKCSLHYVFNLDMFTFAKMGETCGNV